MVNSGEDFAEWDKFWQSQHRPLQPPQLRAGEERNALDLSVYFRDSAICCKPLHNETIPASYRRPARARHTLETNDCRSLNWTTSMAYRSWSYATNTLEQDQERRRTTGCLYINAASGQCEFHKCRALYEQSLLEAS